MDYQHGHSQAHFKNIGYHAPKSSLASEKLEPEHPQKPKNSNFSVKTNFSLYASFTLQRISKLLKVMAVNLLVCYKYDAI